MSEEKVMPKKNKNGKSRREKRSQGNGLSFGIAVGIFVILIVAVTFACVNAALSAEPNEEYFSTTESHATIEDEYLALTTEAEKAYTVFEFDGEKVSSEKIYFKFLDKDAAGEREQNVRDFFAENENIASIRRQGKYVIVEYKNEYFADFTKDGVMELVQTKNSLDSTPGDEENSAK